MTPRDEIYTEIMTITPEIAKAWLEGHNNHDLQRNLNSKHVDSLAKDMADGNFKLNGEAIKFDTQNRLIDGQHRLSACIKANVAFDSLVVHGVEDAKNVFNTLDMGKKRSAALALSNAGYKNSNNVAATARLDWCAKRWPNSWNARRSFTNAEMFAHIDKNPNLVPATYHIAHNGRLRKLAPTATLSLCVAWCMDIDKSATMDFFDKLTSGAGLEEGNPILTLRNKLFNERVNQRNTGARVFNQRTCAAWIFKAWNYWRAGRSLKQIKFATKANHKERFPFPR